MRRSLLGLGLSIMLSSAPAWASSLPSSYTVIDLGPVDPSKGPDYSVYAPSATVTNPLVYSTDGKTAYAFPRSTIAAPQSLMSSIAPTVPASTWDWVNHGQYVFSYNSGGLLTADGTLIVQNANGSGGAGLTAAIDVTASQRQADGSFGPAKILFGNGTSGIYPFEGNSSQAYDINKNGVILGQIGVGNEAIGREIMLFDTKTGESLPLPTTLAGFNLERPTAIDDEGRILTYSWAPYDQPSHELLLVPAGVSSDPVPTPEPATWFVLGSGMVGMWLRSRRRAI